MNNIKYTTDGRKVLVLGNLNNYEKIVQEIFIIDGNEIPSGENFVVKTLHDSPAISWYEQEQERLQRLNERNKIEEEKEKEKHNEIIRQLKEKEKELSNLSNTLKQKLKYLEEFDSNFAKEKLTTLVDFLAGDIKYIVIAPYEWDVYSYGIEKFDKSLLNTEYSKIKLATLYGDVNGNLSYKLNLYHNSTDDGVQIFPFRTYKKAKAFLTEKFEEEFNKEKICRYKAIKVITQAKKHKINVPKEYINKINKAIKEEIENLKKEQERKVKNLKTYLYD